jgi:hypothetical protein
MPKQLERRIIREYERKGESPRRARQIAYATMVARGLWRPAKRHKKSRGRRGH